MAGTAVSEHQALPRKTAGKLSLEGTSGGLQSSRLLKAASRSELVAQGSIQPGCETLLGWRLHNLPGQPTTLFHYPQGEKVSLYIQPESLSFPLIISLSPTTHHWEEPGSVSVMISLQVLKGCCEGP